MILVTGSATVNALGGDDTICVAGGLVDAGAGNDSVTVSFSGAVGQKAILGPGVNHYTSTNQVQDDVVSGVATEPDLDVINGGGGAYGPVDGVTLLLAPGSHPQVDKAYLVVRGVPGDSAAWDVQLPGTVSRDGVPMGTFTNISSTSNISSITVDLGPSASVSVHGTPGNDTVRLGAGRIDADLGRGKDTANFDRDLTVPAAGRLDFGRGHDTLNVDSSGKVSVDLRKGRMGKLGLAGVEESVISAKRVTFQGGPGRDRILTIACLSVLRGGPGNDYIAHAGEDDRQTSPSCDSFRFRIFGQGGNDELYGWSGRDLIDGGHGHDSANGRYDVDVCRAEVEKGCER